MDNTFKRGVMVVPRRNGKDILCWNALVAKAMQRVGLYYYMAPFYNQVRQIIWEGFDGSGRRFVDYIPPELVKSKTKLDMRIDLVNGSQIKLQGSDNIDRIVGTNPIGIVFTEFSLHKPGAWDYLRPILAENGGWSVFNGTPRGLNHFYNIYQKAQNSPDWYSQFLTRDDTGIPSLEAIEEDRRSGMPDELIQQEYYCSFLSGVVGAYYAKTLEKMRDEGRFTDVSWIPRMPVHTVWDLGVGDAMAIWFIQVYMGEYRIIDYLEGQGEGLIHYIKRLAEKPYAYGSHWAPHDITQRELTTGVSRLDTAAELGINFDVIKRCSLEEGIEAVREVLPQCHFDQVKCEQGINALMNYKKRFDDRSQSFSLKPVHDWACHGADAFRYFALIAEDLAYIRDLTHISVKRAIGSHSPKVRRSREKVAA